jgi:large subunit ribosomal protein L19
MAQESNENQNTQPEAEAANEQPVSEKTAEQTEANAASKPENAETAAQTPEPPAPAQPQPKVTERFPSFKIGDTVGVNVRIVEGNKERLQTFEGVVIAIKNAGQSKSFTVRKVSYGIGVERIFPYISPRIESVKLIRRGTIRRSKLYYLREKSGKKARIKEKVTQRK